MTVEPGAGTGGARPWDQLWSDWPWSTWIKPQIDAAASVGANTIRLLGTYKGRHENYISSATYLARWTQFLDYTTGLGLYVYPCGGGDMYAPDVYTSAFIGDESVALANVLAGYQSRVIGFDILQENESWAAQDNNGPTVRAAIKAAQPWLNLTFSFFCVNDTQARDRTIRDTLYGFVDFIDMHLYADLAADVLENALKQSTKPVLIGEFGQNVAAGLAAQQTRYNSIKAIVQHSWYGRKPAGALQWAASDQSTTPSNQWGMFDASFVPRTGLTSIFSSFPG